MDRFLPLNPLIHSPLRFGVISLLIENGPTSFTDLKLLLDATAGNLSIQLGKLESAGYVLRRKTEKEDQEISVFEITSDGISAFEEYLTAWKSYLPRR
jgi:DNA-binding MarR family transcriptional regulator